MDENWDTSGRRTEQFAPDSRRVAEPATTQAPSVIARRPLSDIDPIGYLESDRDYVLNNLEAAVQLLDRALAASVPSTAASVYLVATGETHEGQETYTRHEGAPPPLCDWERLYTAVPSTAASVTQGKNCVGAPGECDFNGGCMYSCKPSTAAASPAVEVASEKPVLAALRAELQGAANYIDVLGGDSKKYRIALATTNISPATAGTAAGERVPSGFVPMPKRLTQAMRDVLDTEGWEWADLLAAAEVITEAEHEAISRAESLDAASPTLAQPEAAGQAVAIVTRAGRRTPNMIICPRIDATEAGQDLPEGTQLFATTPQAEKGGEAS